MTPEGSFGHAADNYAYKTMGGRSLCKALKETPDCLYAFSRKQLKINFIVDEQEQIQGCHQIRLDDGVFKLSHKGTLVSQWRTSLSCSGINLRAKTRACLLSKYAEFLMYTELGGKLRNPVIFGDSCCVLHPLPRVHSNDALEQFIKNCSAGGPTNGTVPQGN